MISSRILWVLSALSVLSVVGPARADVPGATTGQFSVENGAASYAIPITLPPGLGEMRPELSFNYSSSGADGPLGAGWSVAGLSAISRCPQTVAQDGQYVPVIFSAAISKQRYCLDGQRLVITSGSYSDGSMVLRPEIDNFTKVTASTWTQYGYVYINEFEAKTKSGQTIEFGGTPDSHSSDPVYIPEMGTLSSAHTLFANRITDAVGNYIDFQYSRPGTTETGTVNETLIHKIHYTGNVAAGLQPNAQVEFMYETRPDTSYYYAAEIRHKREKRLKQVKISVGGTTTRIYKLGYEQSQQGGQSQLSSVQECGGPSGSVCLPSTNFEWQDEKTGYDYELETIGGAWGDADFRSVGTFFSEGKHDII